MPLNESGGFPAERRQADFEHQDFLSTENGCKRHLITDANGLPLVVQTTPANVNDHKTALEMLHKNT